ncbi:MAG: glycosyltransferase [Terriglobia bacterium]
MRIFQVIEATSNAAVPGSQAWHRNLYEPLVEMGHEVFLFSTEDGRRAMERNDVKARARFSQKLLETFRREHTKKPFDLFFAYLMGGMADVGAIDEIRRAGVPTCNFSCNNAHQFYLVEELSPHFDYNLHSEKDAREKFLAIGATPLWWPMASNPRYYRPYDLPRTVGVSFVGTNYALRARYIAHLLENGVDVHAYGPRWQWGSRTRWRSIARHYLFLLQSLVAITVEAQSRVSTALAEHDFRRSLGARFPNSVHGPISDEELIQLYSRSHLSLGFLEVYDRHDPSKTVARHLHLREFEAPMSGALYCTSYMDELNDFYEPDREVLVYRNEQELIDKVRFYLTHEAEAENVRRAGRARALRDHTYQRRFQQLFAELGLRN